MLACLLAVAFAGFGPDRADQASASVGGTSPHFAVSAEFRPGKAGAGDVAVTFTPRDPDVRINVTPPPRLKLDESQKRLAEKPVPRRAPGEEKYLDTTFPVVFPVAVLGTMHGEETVKGSVTYYYCSHREGWCRKGTADLEIPVKSR
jgi:hypothetical protein